MATKKQKHEMTGLFIKVKCPVKNTEVTVELKGDEVSGTAQECDICGSHGSVSIYFQCPACKEYHDIEIKSW